jgi:3-phenylpropionate/trans-cinnamate dioxygenase ferredoxin reductase subunit
VRIVLAGAGLAAQRCAEALRAAGHDGPITMLGAEAHPPYDRPPLSKPEGGGAAPRLLRPEGWHAEHGIELRTDTPVAGLDAWRRRIELAGAERLHYDRLLIATGAEPVLPRFLAGYANVQVLRRHDDAHRLAAALAPGRRLAVVGAGLIGQEVASTATGLGARVALIDAADSPFDALMGPRMGGWLAALHRARGVEVLTGRGVAGVEGDETVTALLLADGTRVACDHVLVGVGVRPATAWASDHGFAHGVPVDATCRSPFENVFAAGDAACTLDPLTGRHRSAGHWEAAARQGVASARAMLGVPPRPPGTPLVWSDQHGLRLQCLGDPRGADGAQLDGDPAANRFVLTYTRGRRLVAAILVDRPEALPQLRRRLSADADSDQEGMAA